MAIASIAQTNAVTPASRPPRVGDARRPDVGQIEAALRRLGREVDERDGRSAGKLGALRKPGGKIAAAAPGHARQAAAQLVSQLFFAPLLAEMRKLPLGRRFGHGGRMESAFGEQLDLRIADAVAASDAGGLTTQLAARLQPRGKGYAGNVARPPPAVLGRTAGNGVPRAAWTMQLLQSQPGGAS